MSTTEGQIAKIVKAPTLPLIGASTEEKHHMDGMNNIRWHTGL